MSRLTGVLRVEQHIANIPFNFLKLGTSYMLTFHSAILMCTRVILVCEKVLGPFGYVDARELERGRGK